MESPAAKNSNTVCAVMRVPRMVGCPLQMSGSLMICFIAGLFLNICYWRFDVLINNPRPQRVAADGGDGVAVFLAQFGRGLVVDDEDHAAVVSAHRTRAADLG